MASRRKIDRSRLAWIGVGLAIVLFFSVNVLAGLRLTSTRLDLTEDGLYTVSDGTKEVLASIDEPIDIRFYYSKRLDQLGPYFASHARRVDELLSEYARLSGGKLRIERLDPDPFSPEEDLAVAEGLQGLPITDDGTLAYFGVSGRNTTDDIEVIPYLAPQRADFLEYDLTRMIYDLANPQKPVVAVLGDLPLSGTQLNQFRPWYMLDAMFQFFDVRFLGGVHDKIDDDVDVLMLAQAQKLDDKTLYAIDQFVLRGGRVLAFVDPFSEVLASGANPLAGEATAVEAIAPLLEAWGVSISRDQVVGDAKNAQRVAARIGGRESIVYYLPWLALGPEYMAQNDVITGDLERLTLNTVGWIEAREGATTTIEPLLRSSAEAMAIDKDKLQGVPDPAELLAAFSPRGEPFVLAARITGDVESAFAEAPPEDANEELKEKHLAKSEQPINVILVADSDLLADQVWVRRQNLLGREIAVPVANNGDFAINALDVLSGSEGLISLRGRGLSVRPFTVIEAMAQQAEMKYRAKEQELLAKIKETEEKIRKLQEEEQSKGIILTAEQQAEIDDFRVEMLGLRQELRHVQRNLREDVERLSSWIKALNIWAVPAIVGLFAIGLALVRQTRAARRAATQE